MSRKKRKSRSKSGSIAKASKFLGSVIYDASKITARAAYETAKLGTRVAWEGAKLGTKLSAKSVPVVIEAGAEGIRNANPFKDVSRIYNSGKNIAKNGVSKKEYIKDLKQGKFLGKGNGATLGLYGGLVASGAYVPLKITQGALGAGAAVTRNILASKPVVNSVKYVNKNAGKKLKKFTEKDNYRKKVAPKLYEGALGAIGYLPIVAGMWGSRAIAKTGKSLAKSKSSLIKKLGEGMNGVGLRAGNALEQSLTVASLAKAITGTSYRDPVSKYLKNAEEHAEETVHKGVNEAVNTTNSVIYSDQDFGSEEKYAVLIRGYGDQDMPAHIDSQEHSYDSLIKAGFKPDHIYVVGPDTGRHDGSGLSRAFADTSYSHDCSKENIQRIFDEVGRKADGNDTVVCKVVAHGAYDGDNSKIGVHNGDKIINDYEIADMQKNIHAGGEYNIITACQSGNHSNVIGNSSNPGWGNYRPNVGTVSECMTNQNAQAYGRFGDYVMDEIAENGIDHKTDFGKLVANAEHNYHASNNSSNRYDQDPVVYNNGAKYSLVTDENGTTLRAGHTASPKIITGVDFTPIHFLKGRKRAA